MPFVDPQTVSNPTAGQPATAAWGDAVRDASVYLATNKPRARVYNSADISVANNTNVPLTFNSERYDTGATHSTSTNTSRLTVPTGEGGVYAIGGNVIFAANATGRRDLIIRVNGTTIIAHTRVTTPSGTNSEVVSVSTQYSLSAADYVELVVFQNSGGSLNVTAAADYSPEFWFQWTAT